MKTIGENWNVEALLRDDNDLESGRVYGICGKFICKYLRGMQVACRFNSFSNLIFSLLIIIIIIIFKG